MAEQCHFPFVTFEGTAVVVVNGIDALLSSPPASMNTAVTGQRWATRSRASAVNPRSIGRGYAQEPVCCRRHKRLRCSR